MSTVTGLKRRVHFVAVTSKSKEYANTQGSKRVYKLGYFNSPMSFFPTQCSKAGATETAPHPVAWPGRA